MRDFERTSNLFHDCAEVVPLRGQHKLPQVFRKAVGYSDFHPETATLSGSKVVEIDPKPAPRIGSEEWLLHAYRRGSDTVWARRLLRR
jgi:hypothetical protein